MPRHIGTVSRIVMALLLTAVTMSAQDRSEDVRLFVTQRFDAMVRNDLKTLADCLADEVTYTHTTGESQTKTQFLEMLRTGSVKYEQIEPAELNVRLFGETAVVTGRSTMHVQSQGRPLVFQIRFIDVEVRHNGRWQMVAWQATRLG